jgi:hypothetical protein
MRRSLSYTEPKFALAGQKRNWKFIHCTGVDLPKNANIKFNLNSLGREFDWEIPLCNPRNKSNMIWAELENGKTLKASILDSSDDLCNEYEFTLPIAVKAGEKITIIVGTPTEDIENKGTLGQTNTQRRRPFYLHIDPKGRGDYKEAEVFHMDVRGNVLEKLQIIAPSFVMKNKRFDVIVRFEDRFGNLTCNAPENTLIELSYENLRENLNWKLFVPETGFLALPNLYFNEPGLYRLKLDIMDSDQNFFSPPIKCFSDSDKQLFWGTFHNESIRYDSNENIESCLRYFRDDLAYQFYGSSCFDDENETSADDWKRINSYVADFNEDDRFTSFLGFQWTGTPKEEGVRQFIYAKDSKPLFRKNDLKHNSLKKIYKSHSPKEFISIPTFTMGKGNSFNFEDFNPEFEKVVEIYNSWGSSECKAKDGNLFPIKPLTRKGITETSDGSIRNALMNNCRFGFVAGGLDDRGVFSDCYENDQMQYPVGLTAIITKTHSRDSMLDALSKRNCFATTGAKIIIGFQIAGMPMGSELSTSNKPGLAYNRYLTGYVVGTTKIKAVEIIRNGQVLTTFHPKENSFDFEYDDSDNISLVTIKAKEGKPPFMWYYMRIIQEDQHVAWSSPIWVDYVKKVAKKTVQAITK